MGTRVELARCIGPVSAETNRRIVDMAAVNARGDGKCKDTLRESIGTLAGEGRISMGTAAGSSWRKASQKARQ